VRRHASGDGGIDQDLTGEPEVGTRMLAGQFLDVEAAEVLVAFTSMSLACSLVGRRLRRLRVGLSVVWLGRCRRRRGGDRLGAVDAIW
jgi:hypothetical protein